MCLCNWLCKDKNECWIRLLKQNKTKKELVLEEQRDLYAQSGFTLLQTTDEKTAIAVVRRLAVFEANPGKKGLLLLLLQRLGWGLGCVPGQLLPEVFKPAHPAAEPAPLLPYVFPRSARAAQAAFSSFPLSSRQLCHVSPLPTPRQPRSSLASTSHLPAGKITRSHTLQGSLESRGRFRLILKSWVNTYELFTFTPSRICHQTGSAQPQYLWSS